MTGTHDLGSCDHKKGGGGGGEIAVVTLNLERLSVVRNAHDS